MMKQEHLPKEEIIEHFLIQQCKMYSFFFLRKLNVENFKFMVSYGFFEEEATHMYVYAYIYVCILNSDH